MEAATKSKVTPFMREKWYRAFDLYDIDKNNVVEEDDFVLWGRRASNNAGVKFTDELCLHFKTAHAASLQLITPKAGQSGAQIQGRGRYRTNSHVMTSMSAIVPISELSKIPG